MLDAQVIEGATNALESFGQCGVPVTEVALAVPASWCHWAILRTLELQPITSRNKASKDNLWHMVRKFVWYSIGYWNVRGQEPGRNDVLEVDLHDELLEGDREYTHPKRRVNVSFNMTLSGVESIR